MHEVGRENVGCIHFSHRLNNVYLLCAACQWLKLKKYNYMYNSVSFFFFSKKNCRFLCVYEKLEDSTECIWYDIYTYMYIKYSKYSVFYNVW